MQLAGNPVGNEVCCRIGLVGVAVMQFAAGVLLPPCLERNFQWVPDADTTVGDGMDDAVPEAGKALDTCPDGQLDTHVRRVGGS